MRRSTYFTFSESDTKKGRYYSPFMEENQENNGRNRPVRTTMELLKLIRGVDDDSKSADCQSVTSLQSSAIKVVPFVKKEEEKTTVVNCTDEQEEDDDDEVVVQGSRNDERYFTTVWCKKSARKHKKWEGDAVLIVKKQSVILKDMTGKEIGTAMGYKKLQLEELEEGKRLTIGGKEVELMESISAETFNSGSCFESSPSSQSSK